MVDLGGYVIILVETNDKRVKLYGSPADKADLEVADEILEINGKPLHNSSHTEVINHIHNCIKSRTICLRVKRRTGNKLAEELAENSNVQDAFVIAVEQQARERLEKLSALRKIKPVDMTTLSQQLCDSERCIEEEGRSGASLDGSGASKEGSGTPKSIYSAPMTEIGSSNSLQTAAGQEQGRSRNKSGEELELCQTISFQRGDILHVISKDDPHWWQAYRDGEWTQTLAGLIPSLALQQHRLALQRQKREQEAREQQQQSPRRKASTASLLCARKTHKRKRHNSPLKRDKCEGSPYEEMALYYPQPNQKRPLILVGPPAIGRHELRQRLLDDTSKFAAPIPHTTRPREDGEIDGSDYHFVSRTGFEAEAAAGKFLELGEYDKQFYGTSLDSIRTVVNSGKICVLNLQPTSLPAFHDSDLKPYVVFLTPTSPQASRHQAHKNGTIFKEDEYRDLVTISHSMEDQYGQYFDSVIPFEEVELVLKQLMYEISLLEKEPQWVPAKWVEASLPPC